MTAPPPKPAHVTCRKKRRYPDELTARAAAMWSISQSETERLWVYACELCKGWHLTSRPNGRRRLVTEDNPVHGRRGPDG